MVIIILSDILVNYLYFLSGIKIGKEITFMNRNILEPVKNIII